MSDFGVRARLNEMRNSLLSVRWARGEKRPRARNIPSFETDDDAPLSASKSIQDAVETQPVQKTDSSSLSPQQWARVLVGSVGAETDTLVSLRAEAHIQRERLRQAFIALQSVAERPLNTQEDVRLHDTTVLATLIESMTRQTSLVALSAALTAARAGSAGRGFLASATTLKPISEEAQRMALSVLERIRLLETDSDTTVHITHELEALLKTMRGTIKQASLLHNTQALVALTTRACAATDTVCTMTERMSETVETLAHHLTQAAIPPVTREQVERRIHERITLYSACRLHTHEGIFDVVCRNISFDGACIEGAPQTLVLPLHAPAVLEMSPLDRILSYVVGGKDGVFHLVFDSEHPKNATALKALQGFLHTQRDSLNERIVWTQHAAQKISAVLEEMVQQQQVSLEALLTPSYEAIAGTTPCQYRVPHMSFYQTAVSFVFEPLFSAMKGVVVAIAMDRNGYVLVEGSPSTLKQRLAHTMQHDWVALRSARTLSQALVTATHRSTLLTEHEPVQAVSAPIFVCGRHWGCVEVTLRIDESSIT
jgi:methyl-accepting chemotaxis protein